MLSMELMLLKRCALAQLCSVATLILTAVDEQNIQCGTCLNRWFDKTLQLIVCGNGAAGINFEHSFIDGHTVLRFASDVFTDTILQFAEQIRGGFMSRSNSYSHVASTIVTPHKILWRLTPVSVGVCSCD